MVNLKHNMRWYQSLLGFRRCLVRNQNRNENENRNGLESEWPNPPKCLIRDWNQNRNQNCNENLNS